MRTIIPLALIVLVLAGAWWIWPQPDVRPLAPQPDATETLPARPAQPEARVESATPAVERQRAGLTPVGSAAESKAQLIVRCVSRRDNQPLAGVQVRATSGDKWMQVLLTGPDGRASFSVAPGRALGVTAEDSPHLVSQEFAEVPALAAAETREVVLAHDAGEHAHFCGLVVAREGGGPVAGAQVSIEGKPRAQGDAEGRFELDFAAHMPPWLRIDAAGFAPALVSAEPNHETADRARRIELLQPATLEIALQGGGYEARLSVELRGNARRLAQEGVFTSVWREVPPLVYQADADASGLCRFTDLPPGVGFDAQVLGSSGVLYRNAEPIVLQAGEKRRIEWDLGGAVIHGRVLEADGQPARGIELWLLHGTDYVRYLDEDTPAKDIVARATCDADGGFRFEHISPGTWLLSPKPTREIAGAPQKVVVQADAREVSVEVRLARGLFVRGKLVAPDGETGLQGYVFIFGPLRGQASTESDGTFVLGPLAQGQLHIVGSPVNDYRDTEPQVVLPPAENVILRARPGAEVAGRVVDELGNGAQSSITVAFPDGGLTMTRTQPDGSFRLTGLAAANCSLFASTSDGRAGLLADVALAPERPTTDVHVVLRPGATLRVTWQGNGVGHFHFRSGSAPIGGDGLEPGETRTQVVPPGHVTVECQGPAREDKQQQEVDVAPGETRELVFKQPAK